MRYPRPVFHSLTRLIHSARLTVCVVFAVLATISCVAPIPLKAAESDDCDSVASSELTVDPEVADAAWYDGDHATAVAIYKRLVAQNPDNQEFRLSLVVLLREAGKVDEAVRYSADFTGVQEVEHEVNLALLGVPLEEPESVEPAAETGSDEDATGPVPATSDPAASRANFWRGVRAVAGGSWSRAARHFSRSIDNADGGHYPYAHYALGRLAAGRGDFTSAREAYQRALSQDRNLTEVLVPLARAHWELGDYRAAWDQLERARIALPWDKTIPTLLAAWEGERPALTADGEARAVARRAAATPPRVAVSPGTYTDEEVLRVGLVENLNSVYLKAGGPYLLTAGGNVVHESAHGDGNGDTGPEAGDILHVTSDEGEITVATGEGETLYRGTDPIRIGYRDRTYTTTVFDLTYGHGQFSSGREDRSYRGQIEILPRGDVFTVVNRLSVEEYLYSVVPSEMPAWWPEAALEAQAIAARSYTLHPRNRFGERGFDLLSSVTSAYYPGVTNEHPRTTTAVDATRGSILRDGRRPLDAVYSANHAGYAEAAGSVWGWPNSLVVTSDPLLPALDGYRSPGAVYQWLVSRPDSYSGRPPYAARSSYRWELFVPRETIERRLADAGQSVGTIEKIIPGPRGITGRVEAVTIYGGEGETVVRRDAIRSRLGGLRSNLFVVSAYTGPSLPSADGPGEPVAAAAANADNAENAGAPGYFYFQGAGWGHGVGLDQTGAAGMAEAGFDAETILRHYYPRNEIVRWY